MIEVQGGRTKSPFPMNPRSHSIANGPRRSLCFRRTYALWLPCHYLEHTMLRVGTIAFWTSNPNDTVVRGRVQGWGNRLEKCQQLKRHAENDLHGPVEERSFSKTFVRNAEPEFRLTRPTWDRILARGMGEECRGLEAFLEQSKQK